MQFTAEERGCMTKLLESGFVDSFRHLHPDRTDAYTWWSFMPKVRERNIGWRIDYFLVSARLAERIADAGIEQDAEPVAAPDHRLGAHDRVLALVHAAQRGCVEAFEADVQIAATRAGQQPDQAFVVGCVERDARSPADPERGQR